MCNNCGNFGGNNCWCLILLIIILCLFCGSGCNNGLGGTCNGCGCNNGLGGVGTCNGCNNCG